MRSSNPQHITCIRHPSRRCGLQKASRPILLYPPLQARPQHRRSAEMPATRTQPPTPFLVIPSLDPYLQTVLLSRAIGSTSPFICMATSALSPYAILRASLSHFHHRPHYTTCRSHHTPAAWCDTLLFRLSSLYPIFSSDGVTIIPRRRITSRLLAFLEQRARSNGF